MKLDTNMLEEMQVLNYNFNQYIYYYNLTQTVLTKNDISNVDKLAFLQFAIGMNVITKSYEEDERLNVTRINLSNQIFKLSSELQDANNEIKR